MMKKRKKRKSPLLGKGSSHLLRLHMEVKGEALLMRRRRTERMLKKPRIRKEGTRSPN
jgi:hypothetical protein